MNNWKDFTKRYRTEEVAKLKNAFLIVFVLGIALGGLTVGLMCYWGWL